MNDGNDLIDENSELHNINMGDLEASLKELKNQIKRKENLFKRLKRQADKDAKTKEWIENLPRKQAKDKLKEIQRKKKLVQKNVDENEAKQKKLEEDLKPITIGDDVILKDVVDEIITSYTPAVKKAIYKYREKNIEKYNEYARNYNRKKMEDPDYAKHKKEATARSNEKVRLRKLAEREALQKKIILIKNEKPVRKENVIIETNNGN